MTGDFVSVSAQGPVIEREPNYRNARNLAYEIDLTSHRTPLLGAKVHVLRGLGILPKVNARRHVSTFWAGLNDERHPRGEPRVTLVLGGFEPVSAIAKAVYGRDFEEAGENTYTHLDNTQVTSLMAFDTVSAESLHGRTTATIMEGLSTHFRIYGPHRPPVTDTRSPIALRQERAEGIATALRDVFFES